MGEDEAQKPVEIPLDEKQTGAVVDDLGKRGLSFFTWDQLQEMIRQFGPEATLSDLQKALKKQDKSAVKQ